MIFAVEEPELYMHPQYNLRDVHQFIRVQLAGRTSVYKYNLRDVHQFIS